MTWDTAPDLLTPNETASLLRWHPNTVYKHLRTGEWRSCACRAGRSWRIEKEALREKLKERSPREPAPDPMPKGRDSFDAELKAIEQGAA